MGGNSCPSRTRQGALVCKVDVEVLWEPGNFQDDGAKRVTWSCGRRQGVIDNMIVFQKPFPGASRTELESQLQRAVKVSAKGKHVKRKIDLERCLFWDLAGNAAPRRVLPSQRPCARGDGQAVACSSRCATSCWMEPLEAPCCPFG